MVTHRHRVELEIPDPLGLAGKVVDLVDRVVELEAQLWAIRLQSAFTTNAYTAPLGAARASVTGVETGRPDPLRDDHRAGQLGLIVRVICRVIIRVIVRSFDGREIRRLTCRQTTPR